MLWAVPVLVLSILVCTVKCDVGNHNLGRTAARNSQSLESDQPAVSLLSVCGCVYMWCILSM